MTAILWPSPRRARVVLDRVRELRRHRTEPLVQRVVVRCMSCPPGADGRARPVAECVCHDAWLAARSTS